MPNVGRRLQDEEEGGAAEEEVAAGGVERQRSLVLTLNSICTRLLTVPLAPRDGEPRIDVCARPKTHTPPLSPVGTLPDYTLSPPLAAARG